ncbi:MAG: phosphoribosylformylglycinamidine synthase subunit PurQ [Candidatus Sumerlaeaceae bacterium]|nr:phosphoribosylformylglycinamidine synthase subunit PurQ [Candidatus Sumerlaeaceae bacterium]
MKTAVVLFPGSNCEQDTVKAINAVGSSPATVLWHKDRVPVETDLVVLPGGFSYGDYLRAGAIARFSPIMQSVVDFANAGGLVIGICNGFQVLVEARLLPGALLRNEGLHFICKWVHLRVERSHSIFTRSEKSVVRIPIAHGQGRYFIDDDGLKSLEGCGQVVFRYCDEEGCTSVESNPNGSIGSIAGVCNEAGNVLGMMPHPERAMSEDLGSADGRTFWKSLLNGTLTQSH